MERRQLGKNGDLVSVIGLGAWPIGGGMGRVEEKTAVGTVRTAIDSGITLVDTAQAYRSSEATLGKALKNGYRERCFLATKVSGKYSQADIETAIEDSLRALDVDYVDLYQIHGWNSEYPIEESMETMAKVQAQGKTRFIGVSNFNATQLQQAIQVTTFHSNQPRYNMFDRQIEDLDLSYCQENGIGILAHSPLAKGLLTGKYTAGYQFPPDDERSRYHRFQGDLFTRYLSIAEDLQEIAYQKKATLVQLAIAWTLRQSAVTCVLVGAKNTAQLSDHVTAANLQFTTQDLSQIDAILKNSPNG